MDKKIIECNFEEIFASRYFALFLVNHDFSYSKKDDSFDEAIGVMQEILLGN
jgi:hypothetical protein